MALITVSQVCKSYPGLPVLHDIDFTVDEREIVCVLGPSGCGKTTLLRIIAGLEQPDTGQITFAGRNLANTPVHRRNFGLMFQDFALFPHKDVAANVAFGLRMQSLPSHQIAQRVNEMLALVKLSGYEKRRVTALSGGEQQRVALARSLAPGPQLLMLDEPLGSLDRTLREELMNELRAILKQVGVTALYVTHDQEEAFAIADRLIIMRARSERGEGGCIEQMGTPQEIYRQPATRFVAQFLGFRNLLEGIVIESGVVWQGRNGCRIKTILGELIAAEANTTHEVGEQVTLLVRPEAAEIRPVEASGTNIVSGRLLHRSFRGSFSLIRTAHTDSIELTSEVSPTDNDLPVTGEPLVLWLDPAAITLLPS